jgi:exosortase A-associated hydrolase 2
VNPFYFGTAGRRLFGLYTPARGGGSTARAAVLCHPWGREYLRAHRSMRQLASMLSANGVHVLRFDYFGTGDSAGDMVEADLDGWRGDIGLAIEELKDTTGATRVGLVGLRLGAMLAASYAAKNPRDIDSLVLWDPVDSGESYLKELASSASGAANPRAVQEAIKGCGHEIRGFPLPPRMASQLQGMDLSVLPGLATRTLVVVSEDADSTAVRARLAGNSRESLTLDQIAAVPVWIEQASFAVGAVPVKLLQRIVEWYR